MESTIMSKLRETLTQWNGKTAGRMADLLARASEQVDEGEARDTILKALNVMSFFPSLVTLIINLTFDARVPFMRKFQIAMIIAFMLSPGEVILNTLMGPLAYLDDAVLILYMLFLTAQMIGALGEDVIRDNWIGDPAQADELVKTAASLGQFLGTRITVDQAEAVLRVARGNEGHLV